MDLAVVCLRVMCLLFIAFSSASISFTISFTSIFKGFRERVSKVHPKLEELIHCPWCLNHYIVFVTLLVSGTGYIPFSSYTLLNFFFTAFVLTAISGLIHYVLLRAYKPVAEALVIREIKKLESEIE